MSIRVVIVGAGVAGLSCAVKLAEDAEGRFDVRIVAERIGTESLSCVAGASFYPYAVAHPHIDRWLRDGLRDFTRLAAVPASGVVLQPAVQVFPHAVAEAPWRDRVIDYRKGLDPQAIGIDRCFVDGYRFVTPIIEMPVYLDYLRQRFDPEGRRIERASVASLADLADANTIVVNCSGILARRLANDATLVPTLGQVVRTTRRYIAGEFRIVKEDDARPGYVVPRATDCVLGSVDRPWPIERGYEPPPADPAVAREIIARCAELDAGVLREDVLDSYCGLRPRRATVRLEVDRSLLSRGARVVHDYGHGGAGVTLSWGCAAEVRDQVAALAGGEVRASAGG